MAFRCNGPDQDCDNCTRCGGCEKYVECDVCGEYCSDSYYEINGEEICEDCMKENFRRIV